MIITGIQTRKCTRGGQIPGAYAYRTITYYVQWWRPPDNKAPYGHDANRKPRKRTELFQSIGPVAERVAMANGGAKYRYPNGDWNTFLVLAEMLTDGGWQPIDHADLFPEVFK